MSFEKQRVVTEKRPEFATRHEVIIFDHDNAPPNIAKPGRNVNNTIFQML